MRILQLLAIFLLFAWQSFGQEGKKLPPYTMLVVHGEERGKLHCYICEHGEKEGVILFARGQSKSQGEIAAWMEKQSKARPQFKAWVTFLEKDPGNDKSIQTWVQDIKLRLVPVGRFEDTEGPPAYLIGEKDSSVGIVFRLGKATAIFRARNQDEERKMISSLEGEIKKHAPLPAISDKKAAK